MARPAVKKQMSTKNTTLNTVRKIALALSGAEEATAYGSPAFKVRGKMFACLPVHKSAEADSLAVCVDLERRAELLAEAPESYYVTDHYVDHPIVLVRLSRISAGALRDLLSGAHRLMANQSRRKPAR